MLMTEQKLTDEQIIQKYKEEKAKRKVYMTKRRIWTDLMVKKAKAKGLVVTDKEVQDELNKRGL